MYIKKIYGSWILFNNREIVECFDTKSEAELAMFDRQRSWKCLADVEKKR